MCTSSSSAAVLKWLVRLTVFPCECAALFFSRTHTLTLTLSLSILMSVRDVVCRKSFIAQTSDHQFEHGSHSYGFVFSLADAEFTSFQSIYTLIVGAVCVCLRLTLSICRVANEGSSHLVYTNFLASELQRIHFLSCSHNPRNQN